MSHTEHKRRDWMSAVERVLLVSGVALLSIYLAARIHSMITYHAALRSLEENKAIPAASIPETEKLLPADSSSSSSGLEQSHGTEKKIKAYRATMVRPSGTPLALLRIPRLKIEVPVLEGTDQVTLNSGVGRIVGTALPGDRGNIGIAGHRDSFFRALKDINTGDTIQLIANQQTDTYIVDKINITVPEDTSALSPADQPELTLVTCYPFHFIGPAPQRFIVRAYLKGHISDHTLP